MPSLVAGLSTACHGYSHSHCSSCHCLTALATASHGYSHSQCSSCHCLTVLLPACRPCCSQPWLQPLPLLQLPLPYSAAVRVPPLLQPAMATAIRSAPAAFAAIQCCCPHAAPATASHGYSHSQCSSCHCRHTALLPACRPCYGQPWLQPLPLLQLPLLPYSAAARVPPLLQPAMATATPTAPAATAAIQRCCPRVAHLWLKFLGGAVPLSLSLSHRGLLVR